MVQLHAKEYTVKPPDQIFQHFIPLYWRMHKQLKQNWKAYSGNSILYCVKPSAQLE